MSIDRAASVTSAVLCIVITALREHPEFHRLARADIARALNQCRTELEALLREEFSDVQDETLADIRLDGE